MKLYFFYSAMNAGKSASLLQFMHNLKSRNVGFWAGSTVKNEIRSRVGIYADATRISPDDNIANLIPSDIKYILIDEAHFLTRKQVIDLCNIADNSQVEVRAYGLRTDFQSNLFEGSNALLSFADYLVEMATACFCGDNSIMTARLNEEYYFLKEGEQKVIIGNYVSLCRKHYFYFSNNPHIKVPHSEISVSEQK